MYIYISIYIYTCVYMCIQLYMNFYSYHCEPQEAGGISIFGAGLWLFARIQYFPHFLWSSTSRGQRLRAHFHISFPVAAFQPSTLFFFTANTEGLREEWQDSKREDLQKFLWLALFLLPLSLCELITASAVQDLRTQQQTQRVPRRSALIQP